MNLDKCYFRYTENENKIDITFWLKVKDSFRQFNLCRKPAETLETLFFRIGTNVEKVLKKSNKKKSSCDNSEVNVKLCDSIDGTFNEKSTCLELFAAKGPVKLKIHDSIYEIVFNAPWVVSINLPLCILVGFPVYPENFTIQHALKNSCSFNWYKGSTINEKGNHISDLHVKWDLVGETFIYSPTPQDIGMKLKLECIPGNGYKKGPAVETISKNVVEAGPGTCPFETRHKFTNEKLKHRSFRCVTYNILADLYCDSDFTRTSLHPYCPPYALHIDYRKLLIFKELQGYNADIICLQEVDSKIFNHHLQPLMKNEGLNGLFYKKGRQVTTRPDKFNLKFIIPPVVLKVRLERSWCSSYELLSILKNTTFTTAKLSGLIGDEKIVLSEALKEKPCLQSIWERVKDNEPLIARVLDRSTVASASYLLSKDDPNYLFIVGNTHLYFHPDADHIRLIQGGIIIYWLNDIRSTLMKEFPGKIISLILCGDFNSVPTCGIYELYTTGVAASTLPDWKSNAEQAVTGLSLEQGTLLESACGTPQFTNFTEGFADCLDYIFYDKSSLQVEQVVPMPSLEELQANTALPSVVFPSDHIALVADLKMNQM
ncbi:unnamed protein product [Chilo suppressalis]|uniref:Endonuclease/exonuclease/phosphatase domain-containing protein n=1 Tax=Chilo suppressalis TaxID=168631 RepID=A0ABN8B5W5_CHISP|nr:hypothetical protein evm_013272 [Chilo suppressalis]CAH0404752.1 unnamed protein product [Chilo suppressalis]